MHADGPEGRLNNLQSAWHLVELFFWSDLSWLRADLCANFYVTSTCFSLLSSPPSCTRYISYVGILRIIHNVLFKISIIFDNMAIRPYRFSSYLWLFVFFDFWIQAPMEWELIPEYWVNICPCVRLFVCLSVCPHGITVGMLILVFLIFTRYFMNICFAYPIFQYPLLFPSLRMYLPNKYVHTYRYLPMYVSKYIRTYVSTYVHTVSKYLLK